MVSVCSNIEHLIKVTYAIKKTLTAKYCLSSFSQITLCVPKSE